MRKEGWARWPKQAPKSSYFCPVPNWLAGRSELARGVFRTGSRGVPNWLARVPNWLAKGAFRTGSRKLTSQKWHTFHAPERKSQFRTPLAFRTGSNRKSWVGLRWLQKACVPRRAASVPRLSGVRVPRACRGVPRRASACRELHSACRGHAAVVPQRAAACRGNLRPACRGVPRACRGQGPICLQSTNPRKRFDFMSS